MEIRLTDAGRFCLGKSADVRVVTVSTPRAFAMMNAGLAVQDDGFMRLYEQANPKPEPVSMPEPQVAPSEPEAEEKPAKRGRPKKMEDKSQ